MPEHNFTGKRQTVSTAMSPPSNAGVLKSLINKKKRDIAQSNRYIEEEFSRHLGHAPIRCNSKVVKKHLPSKALVHKATAYYLARQRAARDPIIGKLVVVPNQRNHAY